MSKGVNSADVAAFMEELDGLRNRIDMTSPTVISYLDKETGVVITGEWDDGSWLISMTNAAPTE